MVKANLSFKFESVSVHVHDNDVSLTTNLISTINKTETMQNIVTSGLTLDKAEVYALKSVQVSKGQTCPFWRAIVTFNERLPTV